MLRRPGRLFSPTGIADEWRRIASRALVEGALGLRRDHRAGSSRRRPPTRETSASTSILVREKARAPSRPPGADRRGRAGRRRCAAAGTPASRGACASERRPLCPARPPPQPRLQAPQLEIDLVVHDEQRLRLDLEEPRGGRDRAAGLVHVRLAASAARAEGPSIRTSASEPENFERHEPPCRRASSSSDQPARRCGGCARTRGPDCRGPRPAGRASRRTRPDGRAAPSPRSALARRGFGVPGLALGFLLALRSLLALGAPRPPRAPRPRPPRARLDERGRHGHGREHGLLGVVEERDASGPGGRRAAACRRSPSR